MKDFNTIKDIASELNISTRTVRRWIELGYVEAFRPGGRKTYITRRAFEKMIKQSKLKSKSNETSVF